MQKLIEGLNQKLLLSIEKSFSLGIAQGQMGISIYLYHLSRIEQNDNHRKIAKQLLDDTLDKLSLNTSISVENGLAGIALGLKHLIKAGFVGGNINELLEDVDNTIFKHLVFKQSNVFHKKEDLLHLLYYLSLRLADQTDEDSRWIFSELLIKVINIFSDGLDEFFFSEPFSFSLYQYHLPLFTYICAHLLELDFYSVRIYKIIEEFEPKILSRFPVLHANRLYLLCGILPLIPYMQNTRWKDHADLLIKEISLQVIFDKEMKNKHIFVSNGLSMIYLLLHYLENKYLKYKINYNSYEIYDKIIYSDAWNELLNRDYFFNIHCGLLNGFPGVLLVLNHIQNQRK